MPLVTTHKKIKASKIKPYPLNNKKHPESQILEIAAFVKEVGFLKDLVLDENLVILAGHGAYLGGLRAGMTEFPCTIHSGLSDSQKRAYRIADNKLAEKSIWNWENTAAELTALIEIDFDIDSIGFDDDELNAILQDNPGLIDTGEKKKEIEVSGHSRTGSTSRRKGPAVVAGDVFTLGGMTISCDDPESAVDCDWLIRRWQARTNEDAIHKNGETFNTLENARKG